MPCEEFVKKKVKKCSKNQSFSWKIEKKHVDNQTHWIYRTHLITIEDKALDKETDSYFKVAVFSPINVKCFRIKCENSGLNAMFCARDFAEFYKKK